MNYLPIVFASALVLGACAAPQTSAPTVPASQHATSEPGFQPGAGAHSNHARGREGKMMPEMGEGKMKGAMMAKMAERSPMAVDGTTARVEDVEGGAAVVFSTTGDVAELRRRVANMVQMHREHADEGCPMKMHADNASSEPAVAPTTASPPADHAAHHPTREGKP